MDEYARSVPVLKIYEYMPALSGEDQNKSGGIWGRALNRQKLPIKGLLWQ
jgi:hypothetical protein